MWWLTFTFQNSVCLWTRRGVWLSTTDSLDTGIDADGLATIWDPEPMSHLPHDTLRVWVEQFLIIMLDNEFDYGMFWIHYHWMDIVSPPQSWTPTLMRLRSGSYSGHRGSSLILIGMDLSVLRALDFSGKHSDFFLCMIRCLSEFLGYV